MGLSQCSGAVGKPNVHRHTLTNTIRFQHYKPVGQNVDRFCGLVVRVPGYTTEMYCVSCEVRTGFIYVIEKKVDCLCGLVVRVPGYTTEMYCVSCEVQTEFIYVM
jgi:hypothetical protein